LKQAGAGNQFKI